jgi:hypothetical protein
LKDKNIELFKKKKKKKREKNIVTVERAHEDQHEENQ